MPNSRDGSAQGMRAARAIHFERGHAASRLLLRGVVLSRLRFHVAVGIPRKAIAALDRVEVVPRPVVKLTSAGLRVDFLRAAGGHPRLRLGSGLVHGPLTYRALRHIE